MLRNVCEIYTWENIIDIPNKVSEFANIINSLIVKGVNTFNLCTKNSSTSICKEILKLYKIKYPKIKINILSEGKERKKPEYVILFNSDNSIIVYDKEFTSIVWDDELALKNELIKIEFKP
ncbi:MAG: hypothetical protein IJ371_01480 [Clostridia bacterium]|nr:hypothetical protein [Clostridia bacterium]